MRALVLWHWRSGRAPPGRWRSATKVDVCWAMSRSQIRSGRADQGLYTKYGLTCQKNLAGPAAGPGSGVVVPMPI